MFLGMMMKYARRVTRAQVTTGSQFDEVELYSPGWCISLARIILKLWLGHDALASKSGLASRGKIHFDTLRASVINGVSASVIAFASGQGLPLSTTYVAFAAVPGTGLSDRVFCPRSCGKEAWADDLGD